MVNGGSSLGAGGGGGGFIAIYYENGFINTDSLLAYGGESRDGEAGASGVIYLEYKSTGSVCTIYEI